MPVYLIGVVEGCHKIGRSKNPEKRAEQWVKLPSSPRILHVIQTERDMWLEKFLHRAFRMCHVNGEWFNLSASDVERLSGIAAINSENDVPPWLSEIYHAKPESNPPEMIEEIDEDKQFDTRLACQFLGNCSEAHLRRLRKAGKVYAEQDGPGCRLLWPKRSLMQYRASLRRV